MKYLYILLILFLVSSCKEKAEEHQTLDQQIQVELNTSKGVIVLELSNKTPLHRDNFIKIINEGALDSMLFHRIIEEFMVQAGEFDSTKMAKYDSIELEEFDYLVPAEFDSSLFHKRGALGAARNGNPERASASLQFYIVQRGPRVDSLINIDEKRINEWLQQNYFINSPDNKIWKDSLLSLEAEQNWKLLSEISDTINVMAKSFEFNPYEIPEYQREYYRTHGGTPHLDQNYTVFGEVVSGMNVVDSIAVVSVNNSARPIENVYIISARVVKK